jgi:hypothetical protein
MNNRICKECGGIKPEEATALEIQRAAMLAFLSDLGCSTTGGGICLCDSKLQPPADGESGRV